jgi:hypothetical protein
MNDDGTPGFKLGDIANGHLLTAAGWLPLRRLPQGSRGPYYPGDVLNGHAFTGTDWVPVREVAKPGGMAPVVGTPGPGPKRSSGGRWRVGLAIGVAVLVGVGVVASALASSGDNSESASAPTAGPTSMKPLPEVADPKPTPDQAARYAARMKQRGWTQVADNLWGKEQPDGESTTFSVSWKYRVVSPTGCPNGVYMAANVVNRSKTVVGFTNDYLPSLPANQQAILELTASAKASDGTLFLEPTKVTCN